MIDMGDFSKFIGIKRRAEPKRSAVVLPNLEIKMAEPLKGSALR